MILLGEHSLIVLPRSPKAVCLFSVAPSGLKSPEGFSLPHLNTFMYTIGIDPGTSGALTVIQTSDGSIIEVIDLPFITITTSTGKKRKRIEARSLHTTLLRFQPLDAVWIELVHARPGEGAVQAFSFGHTLGTVESLAQTVCKRVEKVSPAVWKRVHGISADKKEARALAQSITGDVQTYRRVRDTDRAESTLIALYGALNRL